MNGREIYDESSVWSTANKKITAMDLMLVVGVNEILN